MTFKLTAFPARDGDCFLLSYGSSPCRHILVDGGRPSTYASLRPVLEGIVRAKERLELLVLSHIDADHIEGLLPLIADESLGLEIEEVWFNGYDELFDFEKLGFDQADDFSDALRAKRYKPNERFSGSAIVIPETGPLPRIDLDGGMALTILSPDRPRLERLRAEWAMWRGTGKDNQSSKATDIEGLETLGRRPMPAVLDVDALAGARMTVDTETKNGSSIAFVAEHEGRRSLLAADAHPTLLTDSIPRFAAGDAELIRFHLIKVSHHGSIGNTTKGLVEAIDCDRFLISTDGSRHRHPDPEAISKILKFSAARPKELIFNYATERTLAWNDAKLRADWDYTCLFGVDGLVEIQI